MRRPSKCSLIAGRYKMRLYPESPCASAPRNCLLRPALHCACAASFVLTAVAHYTPLPSPPMGAGQASHQGSASKALVATSDLNSHQQDRGGDAQSDSVVKPVNLKVKNNTLNIVYLGDSITLGDLLPEPNTQSPPTACTNSLSRTSQGISLYQSNQGRNGHTTVDFLPISNTDFPLAEQAAKQLEATHSGDLVFSVMLGTNDSADLGPNGAPVSAPRYAANLKQIFEQLLRDFPESIVIVHHPTWYSPNTQNTSQYGEHGLERLQSYFPAIDAVVSSFAKAQPNHVYLGDTFAFGYFAANYRADLTPELGKNGVFYLHPNVGGATALGDFWSTSIVRVLRSRRKS
jgi:lysophospholipase L1-like esterase